MFGEEGIFRRDKLEERVCLNMSDQVYESDIEPQEGVKFWPSAANHRSLFFHQHPAQNPECT